LRAENQEGVQSVGESLSIPLMTKESGTQLHARTVPIESTKIMTEIVEKHDESEKEIVRL